MAKCPIHNEILSTYMTTLTKMEKSYACVAGTCPKCKHIYLNIAFFHHYDEIEIQGNLYLYNEQLASEYPVQQLESYAPSFSMQTENASITREKAQIKKQSSKERTKHPKRVRDERTLRWKDSVDKQLAELAKGTSSDVSPSFDIYTTEMTAEMHSREGAPPQKLSHWKPLPHEVMGVHLVNESGKHFWVHIVDSLDYQNEKQSILWEGRAISVAIARTIDAKKSWVYFRSEPCQIKSFAIIEKRKKAPSKKQISRITSQNTAQKIKQKSSLSPNRFCGPSAIWSLSETGVLRITGSGIVTGYNYDKLHLIPWFDHRNEISEIVVDSGITSIGKRIFYNLPNLLDVYLADTITTIEEKAFSKCYKLRSIYFSKNLEVIGNQALRDCTSLKSIRLPSTISSIGQDCFMNWLPTQKIYMEETEDSNGNNKEIVRYPNYFNAMSSPEIYFEDFVTVTNNIFCIVNNHQFEDIQARVNILLRDGDIRTYTIPAGYCKDCNKYFIRTDQFDNLRKIGILLCRMVHEKHIQNNTSYNFYDTLSSESIMKQYGYSVSAKDDLTDIQRKQILIYLMESNIFSRQKIVNHLSWLIQQAQKRTDMISAVSKWTYDRSFVESYQMGSAKIVSMRSLRIRHYNNLLL